MSLAVKWPRHLCLGLSTAALALFASASAVSAATTATIHDEGGSDTLSDDYQNPTQLILSADINQVFGTTGTPASTGLVDRDFFTFNVPAGQELVAIAVMQDSTGQEGNKYFLGVTAGLDSIDPATASASDFLGWIHFDKFSGNVISDLGLPNGATTLGAGDYTFWVQETGEQSSPYGLAFQIQAAVPETGPGLLTFGSFAGVLFAAARRRVLAR